MGSNKIAVAAFSIVSVVTLILTIFAQSVTAQTSTDVPTSEHQSPLSVQLGFSDQTLDSLQQSGLDTVASTLDFNAYTNSYKIIDIVKQRTSNPMPVDGVVLLYQMTGSKPRLIWKWHTGASEVLLTDAQATGNVWPLPGDWLNEKQVLFAVFTVDDSTSWASALLNVFDLHPDQTVTSILEHNIPPGHIVKSAQIQDGKLLLILNDVRGEGTMGLSNCCGPRMRRFYQWDGQHMSDVSATHVEDYYEQLGADLYVLTIWKATGQTGQEPNLYAKSLLELLMIYDAMGQREAGWTLAQDFVKRAKETNRLAPDTYVDTIFLPAMIQLFTENKAFVPPDYLGPNSQQAENFYNKQNN